jgi:hypothetical protein
LPLFRCFASPYKCSSDAVLAEFPAIHTLLASSILLAAFAVLPPLLTIFVGLALLVLSGSDSGTPGEVVLEEN